MKISKGLSPSKTESPLASVGHYTGVAGLGLYSVFAPHSVAAADISIAIATVGWLIRSIATRRTGLRHTEFDFPILLFLIWTVASSFLSSEPRISIAKLENNWIPLVFYVCQAIITKRTAIFLVCLLILSGIAGTVYGIYDLVRGRGVLLESVSSASPFQGLDVKPGDAIWRIDGNRIYSISDIDELLRNSPPGKQLTISLITSGEHVEHQGLVVTNEIKNEVSPSGLSGSHPTHRFRASGWTRHYETFAELLQMIAQLCLGLALANLRNHGLNSRFKIAMAASIVLGFGIVLTAMRTVLVAFALGACTVVWRSLRGAAKLWITAAVALVLIGGAVFIWQIRANRALQLGDPSSELRFQVAAVGFYRIRLHPIFGHGMDAVHLHWSEWGFPGKDMVHLHSTPLQIAFDRGLPALLFWLWIIILSWRGAARSEHAASDLSDTTRYGILLGVLGALTGFVASSLVNYNFGDAEVALLFWWLLGLLVAIRPGELNYIREVLPAPRKPPVAERKADQRTTRKVG